MLASCQCYETALLCVSSYDEINAQNELLRRLGNVRNELGLKYMYWAQGKYQFIYFLKQIPKHLNF